MSKKYIFTRQIITEHSSYTNHCSSPYVACVETEDAKYYYGGLGGKEFKIPKIGSTVETTKEEFDKIDQEKYGTWTIKWF